jgi:poly(3-hydroxybutyrate) depolymerase
LSPSISRAPNASAWRSFFLGMALLVAPQAAAQNLTPGAGVIELPIGPEKQPLTVWYYRPAGLSADDRVVFVMHGVNRNADAYRDAWVRHAQDQRFLLLVPDFSRALFPTTESYNFGEPVGNQRESSSFAVIDRAFDQIAPMTPIRRKTYTLFGHSAGAQFVHRFLTYWPSERVEMAIVANAGAYVMPLESEAYPYGLGGRPIGEAGLRALFARPMIVMLGEADIDPNHRFLPRAPGAMRQGAFRLERGKSYFETAKAEAARLGAPFAWRLITVPGVAHDQEKMGDAAVKQLLKRSGE